MSSVARKNGNNELTQMCLCVRRAVQEAQQVLAASERGRLIARRASLVTPEPAAPMSGKRKIRRPKEKVLEIVHHALPQAWQSRLPSDIREAMPRMRDLVREDPRAAVAELRAWIEREPVPMFYNWLSGAYTALGEVDQADEVVRESYRRNPGYLFGRVNQAELCIRDGDLAGAREALGGDLDITRLLRGRKRIHISEFVAYFYAVGLYHFTAGELDQAERTYELLKEAAPDALPTRVLGHKLHPRVRDTFFR